MMNLDILVLDIYRGFASSELDFDLVLLIDFFSYL